MIGASAPLLTTQFVALVSTGTPAVKLAYAAGAVAAGVYLLNLILSFFLPEPKEDLPE
jgi:hypothetical protein